MKLISAFIIIIGLPMFCYCQSYDFSIIEHAQEITLNECIDKAIKNSKELQIKSYTVLQSKFAFERKSAVFDPVLWSNINSNNMNIQAGSTLDGVDVLQVNNVLMKMGVNKLLNSGSYIEFFLSNYYENTNIVNQIMNPLFKTALGINFKQSILSGRKKISTTYKIEVAEADMQIIKNAYDDAKRKIEKDIKSAFMEFSYCYNSLVMAKEILEVVNKLEKTSEKKFELGEISRYDLSEVKEKILAEQIYYIDMCKTFKESEIVLKKCMGLEFDDANWKVIFVLSEEFDPSIIEYDPETVYRKALNNNYEYYRQQKEIKKKEIAMKVAQANNKPVLNAVAGAELNGMKGNFWDTYSQIFKSDYYSWQIGIEFSVPIGNTEKLNTYKEAALELEKARLELKKIEIDCFSDISIKINNLMSLKEKIDKLQKMGISAKERVSAMNIKLSKRMASDNDVLKAIYEMKKVKTRLARAILENNLIIIEIDALIGE